MCTFCDILCLSFSYILMTHATARTLAQARPAMSCIHLVYVTRGNPLMAARYVYGSALELSSNNRPVTRIIDYSFTSYTLQRRRKMFEVGGGARCRQRHRVAAGKIFKASFFSYQDGLSWHFRALY